MSRRPFLTSVFAALLSLLASSALAVGLITQSGAKYTPSSPPSGAEVTTISLTSTSGGSNLPFMVGQGFRAGDVPTGSDIVSDTAGVTLRAICKRRWNDSSCKHAVLIGTSTLTAGVAKSVSLKTGTAAGGTALTCADIATDAPGASVQVGAVGTVNLSSLLASPFRTWISTPEMVECHYRSAVGADANLVAWFHVRMWAGGTNWVRAYVENGYLNGGPTTQAHIVTVTIGGTNVINGISITQFPWTRYDATGWIGIDPQITPAHNVQYLIDTKLVPNYSHRAPSITALNALDQSYVQMDRGPIPADTSGTGFSAHIGPYPLWDALYFTSADPRAWAAVDVGARSLGAYSLFRRSSATNLNPRPSDFPTTTYFGGSGSEVISNTAVTWDVAHAPNAGAAAYLVTGDYYHYETMLFGAQAWYYCRSTSGGSGVNRNMRGIQNRAIGWGINVIGNFSALAPIEGAATADASVISDFRTWFANAVSNFEGSVDSAGQNLIGIPYMFSVDSQWTGGIHGGVASWMTDFWGGSNWRALDMQALDDPTNMQNLASFMSRFTVDRFGPTGSANYHFSRAGIYGVVVDPTATGTEFGPNTADFYDSMGDVWTATHGSPNAESTNTLQGSSGSNPAIATSYWANALPALVGAVDYTASNAAAAWARLTGATNWPIAGSGGDNCNDIPIFCVVPR